MADEVFTDIEYAVALLEVMNNLGTAHISKVKSEFEARYKDQIRPIHQIRNRQGRTKWAHMVEWARLNLVHLGLMDTAGYGIWTITESGRHWLGEHPSSDPDRLEVLRRAKQDFKHRNANESIHSSISAMLPDKETLLSRAREILRRGVPAEAIRFKDWYVELDDRRVSVKWLYHIATGKDYADFISYQARDALQKIGIQVNRLQNAAQDGVMATTQVESIESFILNDEQRQKCFREIEKILPEKLPALARHGRIKVYADRNFMQVVYPEFTGSHYEIRLGRGEEIAFHLESSHWQVNFERFEKLKPFESIWKKNLDGILRVEKRGKRWAQICIKIDHQQQQKIESIWVLNGGEYLPDDNVFERTLKETILANPGFPIWQVKAKAYSDILARLVEITFPELQKVFPPAHRRGPSNSASKPTFLSDEKAHRSLNEKINQIRNFLEGRSVRPPSDEEVCDWIQLCYFFGLFNEGQELFQYVDEQRLNNNWLYNRTKKYAATCRLSASRRA